MTKFPFPPSKGPQEEEPEYIAPGKRPEFVFIRGQEPSVHHPPIEEGAAPEEEPFLGGDNPLKELHQLRNLHFPLSIRFLCFFFSLLCLLWALGALLCTAALGIVHVATFCQISTLQRSVISYWNMTKKAMIYFLAMVISIFSPLLGICFLLLATFLRGEKMELATFLSRFQGGSSF